MSDLVPRDEIETIVGIHRDQSQHYARAVSAEKKVYILHSQGCLDDERDLRECPYSLAIDRGIDDSWPEDVPIKVTVGKDGNGWYLYPLEVVTRTCKHAGCDAEGKHRVHGRIDGFEVVFDLCDGHYEPIKPDLRGISIASGPFYRCCRHCHEEPGGCDWHDRHVAPCGEPGCPGNNIVSAAW